MNKLSWPAVAEQLRALGVDLSVAAPETCEPAAPAKVTSLALERAERFSDGIGSQTRAALLKTAVTAGVKFFERMADGELVAEKLNQLAPDTLYALTARWHDIRSELLPARTTDSVDLLAHLGVEVILVDTENQAAKEIRRMCDAAHTLGFDIETAPRAAFLPLRLPIAVTKDGRRSKIQTTPDTSAALDPFRAALRLLQVAAEIEGRMVALVIDLRRVPLASPALAPLWCCKLVGHNLSFDAKMVVANGVDVADENLIDTTLMAGLVLRGTADIRQQGSRRPSLAEAVKEALGIDLPKSSQTSPWWRERLTNEQIAYAALDAVMPLKLAAALGPRIDNLRSGPDGQTPLGRVCRAIMPVARLELAGITLDRNALAAQVDVWQQELTLLRSEIANLGIDNPSNPSQLSAWLRRELGRLDGAWVSTWPRTPSGALSIKAKHLRRLMGELPEAELLVRFSSIAQLRSNFGSKLIKQVNAQTGRLHGNFLLAMAKTGRFSSSSPNLQNIPKSQSMRSVFIAAPGKVLVVADYSQLELRVMAEISGDQVMTEAYRNGLDLHAVTAAGMLGVDPSKFDAENPDHKEARQKAKAVNFGVIFGSGPSGLREFARDAYNLHMTVEEARAVIENFLATYPGVARWQRAQQRDTRRAMAVSTVGGRVYRFAWEPNGTYARNLALNLPIQGTAAEIAVEAMIRIDARLREDLPGKAKLVLQVHDEFVIEVDHDPYAVEMVKRALREEMVAAFKTLLPAAPTTGLVDAYAGPNWASAKQ